MSSDPSTLLQATTCVCGVSALSFWCGARLLGFKRDASRDWALANLLFGLGSLFTVLRAAWPPSAFYAVPDGLELLGLACLHAGFCGFLGGRWPWREHTTVVGASVAGMVAAYAVEMPVLRLTIYCAAAAWLLGRTAWIAYRGLRAEFGAAASAVVSTPIALASALQILRALCGIVLVGDTEVTNSLEATPFNAQLAWAAFAIALLLNFAIAGFAGARQLMQIRALTLEDALTGSLNRRALEKLLQRELKARQRHHMALSVVYLDLDHFKTLNDRFGHSAGDAALRHVASVLASSCREGDSLARIGGEEFCVLLPCTELEGACLMAERMRARLEALPLIWQHQTLPLSASFGVACSHRDDEAPSELLKRADQAMYEAKLNGRNCFCAAVPAIAQLSEVATSAR